MLLIFDSMKEEELKHLMKFYEDGNRISACKAFPDCDEEEALQKIEEGFTQWLREEFFPKEENTYYVLEENGQWLSALRLTKLDNFYYLEALHTPAIHRKKGYASKLINEVIEYLKQDGAVFIRDNVRKDNIASLVTHRKCGFGIEHEDAINYLDGERYSDCYGLFYYWKSK